jgi:flavocytochrome c
MSSDGEQVIVVGGGLAGLSCAHTVLERGGRVLLLDKSAYLGGNSTKATSGINGAGTATQAAAGVADSAKAFYDDTLKSARDLARPHMIKVLAGESASAVHWLQDAFQLDLSLLGRLGGHSQPRTHRGKEMFPGMTITYALMEKLEQLSASAPHRCRHLCKAEVVDLLTDSRTGGVVGVVFVHDGVRHAAHGPVVIATGGYCADFGPDSLLAQHRPDLLHLPTTNGPHCTGDGIKLAVKVGAGLADIQQVQVHPTGLVDPTDPAAKVKWLAAEALRGSGALILDGTGKRFCNELGHRDYVTGMMNKGKGPFRLILNHRDAEEIIWHCKHYVGRGLMQKLPNGAALAKAIGVPDATLAQTFADYAKVVATKQCPFGKAFFSKHPVTMSDEFYVCIVTPVLHYAMGGVDVGADTAVISKSGKPIDGLFATGEVMGGVHGANRLGGSSLLDCVVFGRVAGASAAAALFSRVLAHRGAAASPAAAAAAATGKTTVDIQPGDGRVRVDITWGAAGDAAPHVSAAAAPPAAAKVVAAPAAAAAAAPKAAPAAPAAPAAKAGKVYRTDITAAEVAKHNTKDDCWVIVNGEVLDVTPFLNEHPGGAKAILLYAGRDSSAEFNMLHNKNVIPKYGKELIVGKLANAKL